ncbi:MAG: DNA cytosine methyltransferase [Thermoplasmata archaeon]
MKNEFTVIDLFSGAGGLSEGFFKTGYEFISHVEMDKYAAMTLQTRDIYHNLKFNGREDIYYSYISGDISREELLKESKKYTDTDNVMVTEISDKNEMDIIHSIEKKIKAHKLKKVDILIGGPPCQAYSIARRWEYKEKKKDDPKNYLYHNYLSFLKYFKPHIFVFENVPGIKSVKNRRIYMDFLKLAGKMGYNVEENTLDAKDFFVLQKRKRIVFIGWRSEYDLSYPDFKPVEHNYTISDILDDLPPLNPGNGIDEAQEYLGFPSKYLKESGIRNEKDVLIQHRARNQNKKDREIYRYVINIWNTERRRVRYNELPLHLKTHRNSKSFEDRFKVVAPDLKYAQSITAHISKDGYYYIHPDIKQARSITVREAARIQSFPDNYKFEGPRVSQYTQIGNAVPPIMAERIALEIKKMLERL